jgi:hypothetical protein
MDKDLVDFNLMKAHQNNIKESLRGVTCTMDRWQRVERAIESLFDDYENQFYRRQYAERKLKEATND